MKNIIIAILLISNALFAQEKSDDRLYLFANSSEKQVELKWFTKEYSSKYTYKIFRNEKGQEPKLLQTVKPISYDVLKNNGYDEDYIFMVYPYKNIKNINDRIQVAQIDESVHGFRMLKFMRDRSFAKNLGQYFVDVSVKKDTLYAYSVEAYKDGKKVFGRSVFAHTFAQGKKDDFMWTRAKATEAGIGISWDVQKEYNYFNVYRKKDTEQKFQKINEDLLFITKDYAQKAKFLYVDRSLKIGESAKYYIRRVDIFSQEGYPSKEFEASREVKSPKPRKIEKVFVLNTDKKIQLRWAKSYDAIGYNVYRSTIYQGNFTKLNDKLIKKEIFFDKSIKAKKEYYYYITAVNKYGESKPSATMLAYARDTTKPNIPQNLKAKVEAGLISFKWDSVKDDALNGYRIYESMDENAKQWSLLNKDVLKENKYEYKRSKTLSRFPYFYKVSAVDDSYNESYPSKIIKVKLPDVTAPKQPFIKSFQAYNSKITFEWNKIVVYDIMGYNIYKKVDGKLVKLNDTPINQIRFTDTKPSIGKNEYVITAVDTNLNESLKKVSKVIELKDTVGVRIENFTLKKVKNGVEVSFTCKDKDYSGFKLYRSSGSVREYFNVSNFQTTKMFEDIKLTPNTIYFYMIKAYDTSGNITESNILEIKY